MLAVTFWAYSDWQRLFSCKEKDIKSGSVWQKNTTTVRLHMRQERGFSLRSNPTYYSVDKKLVKAYICNTKDPGFKMHLSTPTKESSLRWFWCCRFQCNKIPNTNIGPTVESSPYQGRKTQSIRLLYTGKEKCIIWGKKVQVLLYIKSRLLKSIYTEREIGFMLYVGLRLC